MSEYDYWFKNSHEEANKECGNCWSGYPVKCECGGLVHAEFGDYSSYDSYHLDKRCDNCWLDYVEVEAEDD